MSSVKNLQIQSLLLEVLSEALSACSDEMLHSLTITQIKCSHGKQHAKIYIEASDIDGAQKPKILARLNGAKGMFKAHILSATSWFRAPELSFEFDEGLENIQKLDKIFRMINLDKRA